MQGEYLANFLVQMTMQRLLVVKDDTTATITLPSPEHWAKVAPVTSSLRTRAIQHLNQGSGVLDVAGGAGHVSMALGLRGIQSTVVDPREAVGILPKRDRKIWHRALKKKKNTKKKEDSSLMLCQPAVAEYESMRAWFGEPPANVDLSSNARCIDIPVCSDDDELIRNCSAIVALHPDEATDTIVDLAVRNRIPFVIVPCCVYSRLFPKRRMPNSDEPVHTYSQLLDYLTAKHKDIRRTILPFEGANVALWATFDDETDD
jgi:hypothetical protein